MTEESRQIPSGISNDAEPRETKRTRFPISVEPPILLSFFAFALTDGLNTSILLSRTCTTIMDLPMDNCTGQLDPEIERMVQPYTTQIVMWKALLEAIIAGLLSLFIGPWSDTNGRKPFLVLPLAGFTLYYIGWYLLNSFPHLTPVWFLVPSVIFSLCGGLVSLFTCAFCCITDITDDRNRAFRMAILTSAVSVGIVGGYLLSSFIFTHYEESSADIVYPVAIATLLISLLYTIVFLKESLVLSEDESEKRNFFNLTNIKDIFKAVAAVRPRKGRCVLILCIFIIGIWILILQGDSAYRYLALRNNFSWTLLHYNIYSAVACAVSAFLSTLGSWISTSVFHVHEMYVALFAALMCSISSVLVALARTDTEFYIFSIVGCFGALLNPMLKTLITRTISITDLGKIFAFISIVEAFSPFIASPVYKIVYNSVLNDMPLAIFFLSAGLWMLSSFLIIIIILVQAFCGNTHQILEEDDSDLIGEIN